MRTIPLDERARATLSGELTARRRSVVAARPIDEHVTRVCAIVVIPFRNPEF